MHLKYILLSDGTSDEALIPILEDALLQKSKFTSFEGHRADLSRYPVKLRKLEDKIDCVIDLYNPDVLFIHRDAEKDTLINRRTEIDNAVNKSKFLKSNKLHIKVIPVKMTEAWLLIDVQAIKNASGNRNSKVKISLPKIRKIEQEPDPKHLLEEFIRTSSGLSKRRLKNLNIGHSIQLIPKYITDFSPLNVLPSYKFLIEQITQYLT